MRYNKQQLLQIFISANMEVGEVLELPRYHSCVSRHWSTVCTSFTPRRGLEDLRRVSFLGGCGSMPSRPRAQFILSGFAEFVTDGVVRLKKKSRILFSNLTWMIVSSFLEKNSKKFIPKNYSLSFFVCAAVVFGVLAAFNSWPNTLSTWAT